MCGLYALPIELLISSVSIAIRFFYSKEECRSVVLSVRDLSPMAVARVLGMMAKTPAGLGDQQQQQVCLPYTDCVD